MTDVNKGNPSQLPPMREIAEDLRDGEELSVLAAMYGVKTQLLTSRLRLAGFGTTGHSLQTEARQEVRLPSAMDGNCVTGGVGGGDWTDLPLEPVSRERAPRKRFVGLNWSTSPASGPRWEEVR